MTVEKSAQANPNGGQARLWIGLLDLEILPGCTAFEDSDAKGAAVYFLAMASSADEFNATAREVSERYDFRLREAEEVMPWETWRKGESDVDDYLHERAAYTVKDGVPRFGTFHTYLED